MPTPTLPDSELVRAYNAVTEAGTVSGGALKLGMNRQTLQSRLRMAQARFGVVAPNEAGARLLPMPSEADAGALELARAQVAALKSELLSRNRESLDASVVRHQIFRLAEAEPEVPSWLIEVGEATESPGVPTVFCSDWHFGEVVDPEQVNGVNSYNLEIAQERARRLVERTIDILTQHMVNPNYPGIVVALGGDMISGDIHEELAVSNEKDTIPTVLDLWGVLIWVIKAFANVFGRVFVPCVSGNHGRNTKKIRAKGRNYTNFDWMLYQMLEKHFEDDERISFFTPTGPDALYSIYGHRYLLTHGDQFWGGDGMIGALGPIIRGTKKKQSRNAALDQAFDTIIMGHWHQYLPMRHIIVNGSLKGYDEYANQCNFGYEAPIQALWITHPKRGITFQMPVLVDDDEKKASSVHWVEAFKQT